MSRTTPSPHDAERPTLREAAIAAIGLSLLFVAVYGATNRFTALRSDVHTVYFAWERHIPFVPEMIVPYMSIDLFFLAAPFLCAHRRELRTLSRRIAAAILIAGVSFLLFPLELAVERPHAEGAIGAVFNWFRGVDLPYNLCPSLHIALRTILADLYARHTRGLAKWSLQVWFSLVGLSTLLTYQHHVIDVAGGFVLAAVCFYAVRETPFRLPVERNERVAWIYALGGVLVALAGVALRPWGYLLFSPAVSLAIVAAGYFGVGPGIFDKSNGRLPLSARVILGPVLLGQYLSWLYYRRRCAAWNEVTDTVWIGRRLDDCEASRMRDMGVTAVLDLTVEFAEARPLREANYLHVPVLDLTAPTAAQLDAAVAFISEHAQRGIVYVHCKAGYSRSAAVVGAWLLASGTAGTVDAALAHLGRVRPTIIVRPEAESALRRYERRLAREIGRAAEVAWQSA
jgi:membrane-associated phospholipid phosphatase/predicted protein tyrosine phosphatase